MAQKNGLMIWQITLRDSDNNGESGLARNKFIEPHNVCIPCGILNDVPTIPK
jgi:hypothetical protein